MNKSDIVSEIRKEAQILIEQANTLTKAADLIEGVSIDRTQLLGKAHQITDSIPQEIKYTRRIPTSRGKESAEIAADIIRSVGRFMHKNEILKHSTDKNISSTLSTAQRKGKFDIVSYRVGASKNNTVWGFKDWLDLKGEPREQYMYDTSALRYFA